MHIILYTDGACSGNPGPGGYGIVLSAILDNGRLYEKSYSEGYRLTTNNRMELMAAFVGLTKINGKHDVTIVSDSEYLCNAYTKGWINEWRRTNWKNGKLKNADIWSALDCMVHSQLSVCFQHIKGHSGHPYNELCDRLAVQAYKCDKNLSIDDVYEKQVNT